MKKIALLLALMSGSVFADVQLPTPTKDGGEGFFTLIERRHSALRDDFPTGDISEQELSDILYAGSGKNRGGEGYTIPLTRSKPPYTALYVLKNDGTFLYDFNGHTLQEISKDDNRGKISAYEFVANTPVVLVFVANPDSDLQKDPSNRAAVMAAGSISQNIYLAADNFNISGRFMGTLNPETVQLLQLKDHQSLLGYMSLGKWED